MSGPLAGLGVLAGFRSGRGRSGRVIVLKTGSARRVGCGRAGSAKLLEVAAGDQLPFGGELARPEPAELHPTRNHDLDPATLGARSSPKVWWRCGACGHERPARVASANRWRRLPTVRSPTPARTRGVACASERSLAVNTLSSPPSAPDAQREVRPAQARCRLRRQGLVALRRLRQRMASDSSTEPAAAAVRCAAGGVEERLAPGPKQPRSIRATHATST